MPARPQATNEPGDEPVEVYPITVIDMFGEFLMLLLWTSSYIYPDTTDHAVKLNPKGGGNAPALILEGLMPCAPWKPTVALTIRVLEVYRNQHVCCPQLAIQPFVKALCSMHGVSVAFDT